MALYKSMLVAKADLKMALKVTYVKYGLIGVAALGPIMIIASVALIVYFDPVIAVLILPSLSAMLSPMLGMMAIMPAALISANALVGEREQNTLEPLLSTPLTDRELLVGKLLSSFIPSMALLLGSIAVTEIATIVILLFAGADLILIPGIPDLFLLLTAGPTMIIAIVSVMILISGKVKRVYEAYQTSAASILIFMIPMMLPILTIDATGVIDMNSVWMTNIITFLIAIVIAAITWSLAVRKFNRDTMISM
ncbi:MAG: ABC transporter permease subunit [Candidatus Thorarchaeota archaeon]